MEPIEAWGTLSRRIGYFYGSSGALEKGFGHTGRPLTDIILCPDETTFIRRIKCQFIGLHGLQRRIWIRQEKLLNECAAKLKA